MQSFLYEIVNIIYFNFNTTKSYEVIWNENCDVSDHNVYFNEKRIEVPWFSTQVTLFLMERV